MNVRIVTPRRRSIVRKVKNWREYKEDLKVDFNNYCAYCGSYDGYKHTYYEVDHFVPKSFFGPLGNIGLNQYDNLVYSCKFCNNKKLNKWPSQSEKVYHNGREGFVDPCSKEYDEHLYRTEEGAIMWKTELGKWMHTSGFKFDERERGIRLVYQLNKLRLITDELLEQGDKLDKDSAEYNLMVEKVNQCNMEYVKFHKELMDYYK